MDRRDFLARAGMAATWAAIPITISACSGDDDNNTSTGGVTGPDTGGNLDVTGTVSTSAGHSHSGALVTEVQLNNSNAVDLTLTGSGHTHTASLTAADVGDVAAGNTVSVVSSSNGHTHTVTFN